MTTQGKIIAELLEKFPYTSTRELARIALRDNPTVFPNIDSARNAVRYHRGEVASGGYRKPKLRETPTDPDPFGELPKPFDTFHWDIYPIDGERKILAFGDVHIPFHDPEATSICLHHGVEWGANTIVIGGDLLDFYALSDFVKDPRLRQWEEERAVALNFLRVLRKGFPKADIFYLEGNHEQRWERYLKVKAPELFGCEEFTVPFILKLKDYGITYIDKMRPLRMGKLHLIHGHEYRFPITNPVNPARGLFLRAKTHCVCFHFHQSTHHSEPTLDQNLISTWSVGMLGQKHPEYRPLNNYGHGYALIEIDQRGAFRVQNLRIIDGKAY